MRIGRLAPVLVLLALCACGSYRVHSTPPLDEMTVTQGKAYLAALQDARLETAKLASDLYVAGLIKPETLLLVDHFDERFRGYWKQAADALDSGLIGAFASAARLARQEVDNMRSVATVSK